MTLLANRIEQSCAHDAAASTRRESDRTVRAMDIGYLDSLGDLVSTIGSREFAPRFFSVFRDLLDVEECTVFTFPDPANPRMLIVEGENGDELELARQLARDYVAGGFRTDPNVQRQNAAVSIDIYATDLTKINDPAYRQHYYDGPNVSHELVVIGNFRSTVYYTSFYRKQGRTCFGEDELGIMRAIAGFMIKCLHRHYQVVADSDEQGLRFTPSSLGDLPSELRQQTLEHLKKVLLSGPHKLSQREAEICAGIIMGYSTEAIGLNCSISPNTVATHRKRAYAKLGICSQNELFVRYFSAVRDIQSHLGSRDQRARPQTAGADGHAQGQGM